MLQWYQFMTPCETMRYCVVAHSEGEARLSVVATYPEGSPLAPDPTALKLMRVDPVRQGTVVTFDTFGACPIKQV